MSDHNSYPAPQDAETLRELASHDPDATILNSQLAQHLTQHGVEPEWVHLPGMPPALDGPDRLGRYPITGRLGAGGMGEVLQVRDEDVGREMAAKVILGQADPKMLAKFVREGQITGQLEHPNIVPLYELGMTSDRQVYFTMKRVEGQDLAGVLAEERRLEGSLLARGESRPRPSSRRLAVDQDTTRRKSLIKLLGIFGKVCDALAFAHSRGVIHRDLKPANLMVGEFGEVQVMDWGLAKVTGHADPAAGACTLDLGGGRITEGASGPLLTLDGSVVGTPAYIPPEQAAGETDKLDHRTDVYGLGAILYEILTLEAPFEGDSVWNVLEQVIEGKLIAPSERTPERSIPWELEAVVKRAMASRRGKRYQTVEALKADIEAYLEGRVLAAAEYSTWQVVKKWAGRNKAAAFAVLGVTVAILAGFAVNFWQMRVAQGARDEAQVQKVKAQEKEKEAIKARNATEQEKQKVLAGQQKVLAEQRLKDAARDRMGDVQAESDLRESFEDLGPQGWKERAIRSWVEQASSIHGRLDAHRQRERELKTLGKQRQKAVDRWELAILARLLPRIEKLKENITTGQDWLRDRPWRKWQALNQTKYTARWAEAIAAIRKHPKYEKLDLAPQEGLVPLGPDPKSGLWEFAHLPSGNPPVRGGDRKWKISGQTCIVLVLVPGGKFRMGAVAGDFRAVANEKPPHLVALAPFFISKYELTQGQWVRLAGKNTSKFAAGKTIAGRAISRANPVEQVTWFKCRRLLARTGLVLPTEAQWEYSARAGTRTVWWTGNTTAGQAAAGNVADASLKRATRGKMAGESWDDGHAVHAPVGSFLPNAFGLYDVIGNVYEWCRDPFHDRAYDLKPHSGEEGWRNYPDDASMRARVLRGGSWNNTAITARSSYRRWNAPSARYNFLGSRAARGIH